MSKEATGTILIIEELGLNHDGVVIASLSVAASDATLADIVTSSFLVLAGQEALEHGSSVLASNHGEGTRLGVRLVTRKHHPVGVPDAEDALLLSLHCDKIDGYKALGITHSGVENDIRGTLRVGSNENIVLELRVLRLFSVSGLKEDLLVLRTDLVRLDASAELDALGLNCREEHLLGVWAAKGEWSLRGGHDDLAGIANTTLAEHVVDKECVLKGCRGALVRHGGSADANGTVLGETLDGVTDGVGVLGVAEVEHGLLETRNASGIADHTSGNDEVIEIEGLLLVVHDHAEGLVLDIDLGDPVAVAAADLGADDGIVEVLRDVLEGLAVVEDKLKACLDHEGGAVVDDGDLDAVVFNLIKEVLAYGDATKTSSNDGKVRHLRLRVGLENALRLVVVNTHCWSFRIGQENLRGERRAQV